MGGYDRAALQRELERDEGLRLAVYRCTAGKLSIGVGRNLDDVGIRPAEQRALGITVASCTAHGITPTIARVLCTNDIDGCERDLDGALPWWRTLSDARQRVLLNMTFNMGLARVLGFKKMIAALFAARWDAAANEMLASRWADQVGDRAKRLAAMMRAG